MLFLLLFAFAGRDFPIPGLGTVGALGTGFGFGFVLRFRDLLTVTLGAGAGLAVHVDGAGAGLGGDVDGAGMRVSTSKGRPKYGIDPLAIFLRKRYFACLHFEPHVPLSLRVLLYSLPQMKHVCFQPS